jgi:hypothetical protein
MQNKNSAAEFTPSKLTAALQLTTIHFQITITTHKDLQFSSLALVINMTLTYILKMTTKCQEHYKWLHNGNHSLHLSHICD